MSWRDNIKEWTGLSLSSLLCIADDRFRWAAMTTEASEEYSTDVTDSCRLLLVSKFVEKQKVTETVLLLTGNSTLN